MPDAGPLPQQWKAQHAFPHQPGGVQIAVSAGTFKLQVRWRTALDDDACFARWLLTRHD